MEIRVEGRIGKNGASFRKFGEGEYDCVANFSLAEKKNKKKNGETVKVTVWHDVAVWGKYANTIHEYLKQGRKIEIDGVLEDPEIYTVRDEETGEVRSRIKQKIRANRIKWMDNKGAANPDAAVEVPEETETEPLPFDPDNP